MDDRYTSRTACNGDETVASANPTPPLQKRDPTPLLSIRVGLWGKIRWRHKEIPLTKLCEIFWGY